MSTRKRSYTAYKSAAFKIPAPLPMRSPLARLGGRFPGTASRLSSTELKDITVRSLAVVAPLASANGSTPFLVNPVIQGSSATTRIGRRILMKSLYIRWFAQLVSTTTGGTPYRMLVVYDSQTNGTAPAVTDVVLTDEITSPMNLNNSRRFKTLCDKTWECLGTGGPQSITLEKYIKLNLPVEFNNGNAGTVGDIQTGSIYVICWTGNGLAVTVPTSVFYSRIRFSDT